MSSSPSFSISMFENLPTRPPTPPKDALKEVDEVIQFLVAGHDDPHVDGNLIRQTSLTYTPPPSSPPSSQVPSPAARKKVDFSPWPTYYKASTVVGLQEGHNHVSVCRNPTATIAKPLKSILKPGILSSPHRSLEPPGNGLPQSPAKPEDFSKMLQSALRQLNAQSPDTRLDGYFTLNGAIRAYEGIPDANATVQNRDQLLQHCCRDMMSKDVTGGWNIKIATQALQLIGNIFLTPHITSIIGDEIKVTVTDKIILTLESTDTPKAIIKAHIYVLCQLHLASIMTAARTEKLLESLQQIETRCTGNGVISGRLLVYKRLIEQIPAFMLNKMPSWIGVVLNNLVSPVLDVRAKAIEVCTRAALRFGAHPQASTTLMEVLEADAGDGLSYNDLLLKRMNVILSSVTQADSVPRIWSAVILFFRSKRRPLESWSRFKDWLLIIQKCLNSNSLAVKLQAGSAWDKLVFSVMPDSKTQESLRIMLRVPIIGSLERRTNDKFSRQVRDHGMSSYCNLLHYALRPALSFAELDHAWDVYVGPMLSKFSIMEQTEQQKAWRVLSGLLTKNEGAWNINAVNEPGSITPQDLPTLDPQWVRSRLDKYLKQMATLIVAAISASNDDKSLIVSTWRLLLQAVGEANSQEIKTSPDCKLAIARLMEFFRRLWIANCTSTSSQIQSEWISLNQDLIGTMLQSLQPNRMLEGILDQNFADAEIVPTPSHKSTDRTHTSLSPLLFLFEPLYQSNLKSCILQEAETTASLLLDAGLQASPSPSDFIGTLYRLLHFCSERMIAAEIPIERLRMLWQAIAFSAIKTLELISTAPASIMSASEPDFIGAALEILAHGRRLRDQVGVSRMIQQLLILIGCHHIHLNNVRHAMGDYVKFSDQNLQVSHTPSTFAQSIEFGTQLLENTFWADDGHAEISPRSSHQAVPLEAQNVLPENIRMFICKILDLAYENCISLLNHPERVLQVFLWAITNALQQSTDLKDLKLSITVFEGFATWLTDPKGLLFERNMSMITAEAGFASKISSGVSIAQEIVSMWKSILDSYTDRIESDCHPLKILLPASLSSPSDEIVCASVLFCSTIYDRSNVPLWLRNHQPLYQTCQARLVSASLVAPSCFSGSRPCAVPLGLIPRRERDASTLLDDDLADKLSPDEIGLDSCHDGISPSMSHLVQDSLPEAGLPLLVSNAHRHTQTEQPQIESRASSQRAAASSSHIAHPDILEHSADPFSDQTDYETMPEIADAIMTSDDLSASPTPRAADNRRRLLLPELPIHDAECLDTEEDLSSSPPTFNHDHNPHRVLRDNQQVETKSNHIARKDGSPGFPSKQSVQSQGLQQLPNSDDFIRDDKHQNCGDLVGGTPSMENLSTRNERLDSFSAEFDSSSSSTKCGSRKRKRSTETIIVARKRKQQSPLKHLLSTLLGQSRECDNDADEDIVVASSQATDSLTDADGNTGETADSVRSKVGEVGVPKRGRGRPRKIRDPQLQANIDSKASDSYTHQKKQSQTDCKSANAAPRPCASIGQQSCVNANGTERRRSQRLSQIRTTDASDIDRVAVHRGSEIYERKLGENTGNADLDETGPSRQLEREQLAAMGNRPIAQPKSILARLKSVFQDCRNLLLAPQEVREFDDMLFEIRREIHYAGDRRAAN